MYMRLMLNVQIFGINVNYFVNMGKLHWSKCNKGEAFMENNFEIKLISKFRWDEFDPVDCGLGWLNKTSECHLGLLGSHVVSQIVD